VTPEAADGGPLSRLRTGDLLLLDAERGMLEAKVDPAEFEARSAAPDPRAGDRGYGRELFAHMRRAAGPAELGAGVFFQ